MDASESSVPTVFPVDGIHYNRLWLLGVCDSGQGGCHSQETGAPIRALTGNQWDWPELRCGKWCVPGSWFTFASGKVRIASARWQRLDSSRCIHCSHFTLMDIIHGNLKRWNCFQICGGNKCPPKGLLKYGGAPSRITLNFYSKPFKDVLVCHCFFLCHI